MLTVGNMLKRIRVEMILGRWLLSLHDLTHLIQIETREEQQFVKGRSIQERKCWKWSKVVLLILLKMSLITVMNQKLSRMTMTQSSIRDAVQISNNYNNGHVFQIITINTCLHVTSFVLLKGKMSLTLRWAMFTLQALEINWSPQ